MRNKTTYALWTIQGLLALIFLFAGGMKLAMSTEELAAAMTLPLPICLWAPLACARFWARSGWCCPASSTSAPT